MAWTDRSTLTRPDSIPNSTDPLVALKRRQAHAHWLRVASRLPKRARLLEIGAGSCLVSKWLIATRADLNITASDCGDYPVDPIGLDKITFLPRTRIEQLPFVEGSFDAIVSQFAFEYAAREKALRECARVLQDGGRLFFLMHARGGALHDACTLRVAAGRMIQEAPSVVSLMSKAAQIQDLAFRSSMYRLVLGPRIADRLQRLLAMETEVGITLPGLREFLEGAKHHVGRVDFSQWLDQACKELSNSLFVGQDQLRSALDLDDVDQLSRLAESIGLRPGKAHASEFAWAWSATK